MSMEADLTALLKGLCPRVFPDFAPAGTLPPYITYQGLGGRPQRYADNTAANKRHTHMQISVWAATRAESLTLVHQVEDALCAAAAFTASQANEPFNSVDADREPALYGCVQDFDIWAAR